MRMIAMASLASLCCAMAIPSLSIGDEDEPGSGGGDPAGDPVPEPQTKPQIEPAPEPIDTPMTEVPGDSPAENDEPTAA